jgi:hypothetical protein
MEENSLPELPLFSNVAVKNTTPKTGSSLSDLRTETAALPGAGRRSVIQVVAHTSLAFHHPMWEYF